MLEGEERRAGREPGRRTRSRTWCVVMIEHWKGAMWSGSRDGVSCSLLPQTRTLAATNKKARAYPLRKAPRWLIKCCVVAGKGRKGAKSEKSRKDVSKPGRCSLTFFVFCEGLCAPNPMEQSKQQLEPATWEPSDSIGTRGGCEVVCPGTQVTKKQETQKTQGQCCWV
jgi:hypothetical protein